MKKLFLSLIILLSLSCVIFAADRAEKEDKSSKNTTFIDKYYTFAIDGDTITIYFCDDGFAFLASTGDETIVRKYSYNKSANLGFLFDQNHLDSQIITFEYDSKKDIIYIIDGRDRYAGKPPRIVTPRR
jgi:hypothetical protein